MSFCVFLKGMRFESNMSNSVNWAMLIELPPWILLVSFPSDISSTIAFSESGKCFTEKYSNLGRFSRATLPRGKQRSFSGCRNAVDKVTAGVIRNEEEHDAKGERAHHKEEEKKRVGGRRRKSRVDRVHRAGDCFDKRIFADS